MNLFLTSVTIGPLLFLSCGSGEQPSTDQALPSEAFQGVFTSGASGAALELCSGARLLLSGTSLDELITAHQQHEAANPGSALWVSIVGARNTKAADMEEKGTRNIVITQVVSTEGGRDCGNRFHGAYYSLEEVNGAMSKMEMREDGTFDLSLAKPDGSNEQVAGTWKSDGDIVTLTSTAAAMRFLMNDAGIITQQDVVADRAIVLQRQ